ncbi:MAG TPA: hypothetical protein VIT45_18505 [Allosphingosinicella sp.]
MRIFVLAAAAAAILVPASAASAQRWGRDDGWRDYRHEVRDCRRDLRRADTRREYRRAQRECRRDLRRYQSGNYWYHDSRFRSSRYWDGYRWRTRG